MPRLTDELGGLGPHIPAWRRLGLQLKSGRQSANDLSKPAEEATSGHKSASNGTTYLKESDGNGISPTKSSGKGKKNSEHSNANEQRPKRLAEESTSKGAKGPKRRKLSNGVEYADPTSRPASMSQDSTTTAAATRKSKKAKKSKKPGKAELLDSDALAEEDDADMNVSVATLATPALTRRKSVTFTPDTKTQDGDSAQQLFKAWVEQQKATDPEYTEDFVAEFEPPPSKHVANSEGVKSEKPKKKEHKSRKALDIQPSTETASADIVTNVQGSNEAGPQVPTSESEASPPPAKPSKKELKVLKKTQKASAPSEQPQLPYLIYLQTYHTSRENWKFNKARQIDLLKNIWNLFRVPFEHDDALVAYVSGLQGDAARSRLREAAQSILSESKQATEKEPSMDTLEARQTAYDHALDMRIRQQKLLRAERLLEALGSADKEFRKQLVDKINGKTGHQVVVQEINGEKRARKRKRRVGTEDSPDESSSSEETSSSEDPSSESSSDEESDESDSESEQESDSEDEVEVQGDDDSDDGSTASEASSESDTGEESSSDSSSGSDEEDDSGNEDGGEDSGDDSGDSNDEDD